MLKIHNTDQYIHPRSDFSRIEQTPQTQGPTTPVKRSPAFHETQHLGGRTSQPTPDGGVTLTQQFNVPQTLEPALHRTPPATPLWSTTSANVGRRRLHNSVLLRSPARPRYTTRMKQMFEDAGSVNNILPDDRIALYPQLPNISRAVTPSPRASKHRGRSMNTPGGGPGSLLPPNEPLSPVAKYRQFHRAPTSRESSGSWSDDSGYIHLSSHSRPSTASESSEHRIHNWLATVSQADDDTQEACMATSLDTDQVIRKFATPVESQKLFEQPELCRDTAGTLPDPFINRYDGDGVSSKAESSVATEDFYRLPLLIQSQRHISDVCKHLDFGKSQTSAQENALPTHSTPGTFQRFGVEPQFVPEDRGEGGIELSPLSPNVCIERGPSRYHSASNKRPSRSPEKRSPEDLFLTPRRAKDDSAKENTAIKKQFLASPEAANFMSSARKGPRFWRRPGTVDSSTRLRG